MKRIFKFIVTAVAFTSIAVGVVWQQFYGGAVTTESTIYLSDNDLDEVGYQQIVDSLVIPNIKHHAAFNYYAERLNLSNRIKPGRYELKKGMGVVEIVRMFKLSLQSPVMVTFNNVRLAEDIAGKISKQIKADSAQIITALKSDELAREYGFNSGAELISIFMPNSYEMWWETSAEELVKRMKQESDKFWNETRESRRKELNMSRVEVVTLASIVYEECAVASELRRVAGVYMNRLRRGMRLQADPTVKYAVGDFSLRRVLHKHLECDSPYNTYLYRGLPPSPISIPTSSAIDAVLNFEEHKYLYFCARPEMDGRHNFSTSYMQHLEHAQHYAAALNRKGIR